MATQAIENLNREAQQKQVIQKPDITQETWYQKLPENQRTDVLKIRDQIAELEKRLDVLNASKKHNGSGEKSLKAGIARLQRKADADTTWKTANPEREKGDEAKRTFSELNWYESRFEAASKEADGVTKLITALNSEIEKVKSGIASMEQEVQSNNAQKPDISKMTNAEILKLDPAKRLPYITKWNTDTAKVASGETKNLEFTFSSGGKLNRDLYIYTTAGQVLPNEVRSVTSEWTRYERIWVSGEFYNIANQKRLTIHEWTKITVQKLATTTELDSLSKWIDSNYQKFLEENPKYNTKEYQETVKEIFKKGLWEKEAKIILENTYNDLQKLTIPEAERLLTVTRYLKNGWFLDGFDHAEDLIENIEEIIKVLKEHGSNLRYSINQKWKVEFEMDKNWLPVWIEWIQWAERVKQIALSELGTTEHDGSANKYFWFNARYSHLDARNVPWCAAFVNWTLAKAWVNGTDSLAAKSFIGSEWFGHVGFKVWNKILWGNQGNRVSLMPINKPIVWYAIPVEGKLEIHRWAVDNPSTIPEWAIIVYDRSSSQKQFS